MGFGIEQVGEIPLVQHGHLRALGAMTGQRAEIEPKVAPVQLLYRQLQGIEQPDRLTVPLPGPLAKQVGQQRKLPAEAALPLLALLAGDNGVSLLQPAKPEQGTEGSGPLPLMTLGLPLAKGREQPLTQRAALSLRGNRLQGRPQEAGVGALAITAEPAPLRLECPPLRLYLVGTAGQCTRQWPALFIGGIEQQLQREVFQQQLLPGGAGAGQQLMGIGGIKQGEQIAGREEGRDLARLAPAQFAHHSVNQILTGHRGDTAPVRGGAHTGPHAQDQRQRPLRRQAPLLLPTQSDKAGVMEPGQVAGELMARLQRLL